MWEQQHRLETPTIASRVHDGRHTPFASSLRDIRFVLPLLFLGVVGNPSVAIAQSRGTFTTTGNMSVARFGHTATLLPNGKVLIAGGVQSGLTPGTLPAALASAELYDPATGTSAATGNMTTVRAGLTATLLPTGKVLIAG